MKLLEEKILAEGIAESENILKVDSFINHQVDPELMKKMGKDIAEHYKGKGITRIATIESSGTHDSSLFERSNDHFKETAF